MASGASVGSFAGGFGKALAGILVNDRNAKRQEEQQDEEMRMRADMATLPIEIDLAQQNNNWVRVEELLERIRPGTRKQFEKQGNPFQILGPMLGGNKTGAAPQQTGPGQVSPEGTPAMLDAQPPLQNQSAIQPATPPPPPAPGSTFFGTAMPSQAERLTSDMRMGVEARRKIATELGMSPSEAVRYAATGAMSPITSSSLTGQFGGLVEGSQIGKAPGQYYRRQLMPDGTENYLPVVAPTQMDMGDLREAAARELGYPNAEAAARAGKMQDVNDKADELAQSTSQSRGAGTAQAKFEAPIDIPTAQSTGQTVGTSAAQVAGQVVPKAEDVARLRSLEVLKGDLNRILGTPDQPGLLSVLPSKNELAGVAPGAVYQGRKRMNAYRERTAQLESAVDNMVNVLARARAEQRGTQTEKDAERAYNAVVQLQAGLFDPLGGDTRESAEARIKETLEGLDRVMASIPKQTTPGAAQGGGGSTTTPPPATGGRVINKGGILYRDGVELPGQR